MSVRGFSLVHNLFTDWVLFAFFCVRCSEVATEEVDHLFVAADEDHDNRLSYKEIIDQSETFVGSEATDYGEHLNELGHVGDEL